MITAPVQTALVINAPAPVTVTAPDTKELVKTYTEDILPLDKYRIETPQDYVQASLDWEKAKSFVKNIDELFEKPVKLAHQAHTALTTLRKELKDPALRISNHLGNEILRYSAEQERQRKAEEARLQAIENARIEAERAEKQRLADEEHRKAIAAREAALAEVDPWDVEEETLPAVPAPVVIQAETPAPVRISSSVPQVFGGPRTVLKPWAAVIDDPTALLKWILENTGERLLYVQFWMPELNSMAREHGENLSKVIPGVRAVREQTLKRS